MLAARLKNIFFTLLAMQVIGATTAFLLCRQTFLALSPASAAAGGELFSLGLAFFLATVFFLVLFHRRTEHFGGADRSVTAENLIGAEKAILSACAIASVFGPLDALALLACFAAGGMALVAVLHFAACSTLNKIYNHPNNKLNVLVLGMNHRTVEFCDIIRKTGFLGAEVHGYLDAHEIPSTPVRYLGTIDDLKDVLHGQVIDIVSIFLPIRSSYDIIDNIIKTCRFYGVTSYIVGNVFGGESVKRGPTSINDFGYMAFSSVGVDYAGLTMKRIFDFLASLAALIVLSPFMLAVAAFIKIVSPGPAFFTQDRVGLHKRPFRMMKFRSMVPDAEKLQEKLAALNEMDGAAFKIKDDPRIIPGGSFLRRHSLDELPQLWNVLRGDMSIVGPRPLSRRDFERLEDEWQRRRFSMRPGLTCTWQVSGRNDVTFEEWMRMDLDYIDRWRFSEDFWLIARTFRAVFVGSGR